MAVASKTANFLSSNLFWRVIDDEQEQATACQNAVRHLISQVMDALCIKNNKLRWCDKSVTTLHYLDVVVRLFPDAQFICLHRHALDMQQSGLEAIRHQQAGDSFGFDRFVAAADGDTHSGLLDYWILNTQLLLNFEEKFRAKTFRLRYEDLVTDPKSVTQGLTDFLELEWEEKMVDEAFTVSHLPGPG